MAPFSLLQKGSQFETPLYIEFPKTTSAIVLRAPDSSVLRPPGVIIYPLF